MAKSVKLEFIARLTTEDGQEIEKMVSTDIPSPDEVDINSIKSVLDSFEDCEQHALKARNEACEEIIQAWFDRQAKKGDSFR